MLSKLSLQQLLSFLAMVGMMCVAVSVFFPTLPLPDRRPLVPPAPASAPDDAPPQQPSTAFPIRLMIPKINVDASLEQVGLTAEGKADVPTDPSNAAWLDTGPRPGEEGTAVIDGHFGWKDGIPAVFDDLTKLQKGDQLYVEDDTGATLAFTVRSIRTYGEHEDTSGVFGSSDGKAHLNLITCEGAWNTISKTYSKRLVVFTDGD